MINNNYDIQKKQFNDKLKQIKTYKELKEFEKELYHYGFTFYSKRSLKSIYKFSHLYEDNGFSKNPYAGIEKYKNKVSYLYDDGTSVGEAYIKNLYKYFEIR